MNIEKLTLEEFQLEVLKDYRIVCESREASLIGRKEVLTGKAKFGILNSEAYTTSIEVILNNSEDTDSKKPDYLLYKLTKENTPDISDPSDELKKLSRLRKQMWDQRNKETRRMSGKNQKNT